MKKYIPYIMLVVGLIAGGIIGVLISKNQKPAAEIQEITISDHEEIWTCSMHPQIRQHEPGECPICGMDLIPADNIQTQDNPTSLSMTESAVKLANIQTTIIGNNGSTSDGKSLRLNGSIEADERQTSSLAAHIPGRIEKLYVGFTGEYVRKGQRIAKVYSPELITAQRELIEAKKIQDISPALLNAARNKLKFWKLPEATIDKILEEEVVREYFDIYADNSGIVQQKNIQVGDHVMDGSVLFVVQNLSRLWVIFEAYESDLPSIKLGDKITFTTPAIPNKTFTTTISFIDPIINKQTRIARIRGEVNNSTNQLKPEMYIEGLLSNDKNNNSESTLLVPKSAVLWTGERSVVYIKDALSEVPSFEYRSIELGERIGDSYQVKSGLQSGDAVVTNGAFIIDASAQLNNRNSMMNQNVSIKQKNTTSIVNHSDDTPIEFKNQLGELTEHYLKLKDALTATDANSAQSSAQTFNEQLKTVDMMLLKGAAHDFWMEQLKGLKAHSEAISASSDIEIQRDQFYFLSQALIKSLKSFGINNKTYYIQHCPMANSDKGADWISKNDIIQNPYFGEKMMKCGYILDTLKFK